MDFTPKRYYLLLQICFWVFFVKRKTLNLKIQNGVFQGETGSTLEGESSLCKERVNGWIDRKSSLQQGYGISLSQNACVGDSEILKLTRACV